MTDFSIYICTRLDELKIFFYVMATLFAVLALCPSTIMATTHYPEACPKKIPVIFGIIVFFMFSIAVLLPSKGDMEKIKGNKTSEQKVNK